MNQRSRFDLSLAIVLGSFVSLVAHAGAPVLPAQLSCDFVKCIEGLPTSCTPENYGFPLVIQGLDTGTPTLTYTPLRYVEDDRTVFPGTVRSGGLFHSKTVVLDFTPIFGLVPSGITDLFRFSGSDLAALKAGTVTQISGTFTEGPYWYDSPKDFAQIQLECH